MSVTKIPTKATAKAIYQQAINGVQTYLGNRTLLVNGKPVTSKAAISVLQQGIDAMQASADAHTAWLQAVAKERTVVKTIVTPFLTGLRHYVIAMFGLGSDQYLAFGFPAAKPQVKSPAAKIVGAVKALATRKARNTMGSRQRRAVTGSAPSAITVTVGSVPTVAAAQPAPAPAASATVTVTPPTNGALTSK
jgi:hypothetical protein